MIDDGTGHAYKIEDALWAEPAGKSFTWSVTTLRLTTGGWNSTASDRALTATELAQVQRAFAGWTAVANVSFVQVADASTVDIRIGAQAIASTSTVGETQSTVDSYDHLQHAQIELNTTYLAHSAFTADNIYAVALHEIGHAIGLDHSDSSSAIMYFSNAFESRSLRTQLSADDIAAVQYIFGAAGSTVDAITGSTATSGSIAVGQSLAAALFHPAEMPWYRVSLVRGQVYEIDARASDSGRGTLNDPYLILRDSSGRLLDEDDDSGSGRDAHLSFTASSSGTYYIDAESASVHDTGSFTLSVAAVATVTTANATSGTTLFGSADRLTRGTGNGQTLVAGAGSETLIGDGLNSTLFGGSGADSLVGGSGDDILVGGSLATTMDGGAGLNLYVGGSGTDLFEIFAGRMAVLAGIGVFGSGDKIEIHALAGGAQDAASQEALQISAGGSSFLYLGRDALLNSDKWLIVIGTPHIAASDLIIGTAVA